MSQNLVILCAAGMLVTAYVMVGQKSLFVTIRLYGLQSLLLGVVAVAMAFTDHRPHLLESAALTIGLKGVFIPGSSCGRSTGSASTARSSPS